MAAPPSEPQPTGALPPGQKPIPRWRTTVFPWFAAPISVGLRAYAGSVRWRVEGEQHLTQLIDGGQRFIPCCWHQRQGFVLAYLLRLKRRGLRAGALVSPSKDGELVAQVLKRLGITAVRGSGRRSGAKALRDVYQAIREADVSPLIAPDGSKGPMHEFKPGAIMLARLAGVPVVPISVAASPAAHLPVWDRTLVPIPGCRLQVVVGEPIHLEPLMAMEESPETVAEMGRALSAVEARAEALLGGDGGGQVQGPPRVQAP